MELLKKPDLVERYWDFLLILEANNDKGMTTSEVVEYSKTTGIYDMSVDNNVASKVASDMRLKKGLIEVSNKKHYLSPRGKKALEARRQKDTVLTASNLETPAIVFSEADALSFEFEPGIPPENNPLPTLGELNAFINGKPEEAEEIEILDVEQTLVKNSKYPFLDGVFDSIVDWLDAEVAVKTVFIEDKGRKIALLNKIAVFPLFDEEVREKLHEIAIDLEKLIDIE